MSWPDAILFVIVAALGCASMLYALLAQLHVQQWMNDAPPELAGTALPPVTLLRPLKAGVLAYRENFVFLALAMHPDDQLVLGLGEDSGEMETYQALIETFPERDISLVICRAGAALNPKISKLLQMVPHARHDHWVLSDSETFTHSEWLDAFRREWVASGADVLTAGYRFVNCATWPQRLDAAAVLLGLWPGLAMVRRFGHVDFTLGACTGLRRADVEALGGWAAFGDFLAEDNRLGAALAKAGRTIRLSAQVATLDSDPLTWRDYWRHQRRVAVTYRVCSPAGFAGMVFTSGLVASVLLIALAPGGRERAGIYVLVAAAIQFARWIWIRDLGKALRFSVPWLFPVMLAAGVVEIACWCAAWCDPRVWWAGRRWRVSRAGRLMPEG